MATNSDKEIKDNPGDGVYIRPSKKKVIVLHFNILTKTINHIFKKKNTRS